MDRRVRFRKGQQKRIVLEVAKQFGSIRILAEKLGVPYSTLKKYAYESLLMPENVLIKITHLFKIDLNNFDFIYLDSNWGNIKAGKQGMNALEKKYPDKISGWRKSGVRRFSFSNIKQINKPKVGEDLAELFGVYLGDGTLTKYFIRIAGDSRYDLPYFKYLDGLVYKLFGVNGKVYFNKKTNNLYYTIFSKKICDFFNNQLGIQYGDKLRNNTLIPQLFLGDSSLALACLRGLIDTDGCISLRGQSFSVSFYSKNPNLIKQIADISKRHGLFTYISRNEDEIGTNSNEKIIFYFKKVGSSNLRHIVRFYQKFVFGESIYQSEVVNYYQKSLYRDLKLPFKTTS